MPRGMLWGVAFQKWLSRSASTGISGGGRGGERQTQRSTFLGGSVPAKWISGPRFGHLLVTLRRYSAIAIAQTSTHSYVDIQYGQFFAL